MTMGRALRARLDMMENASETRFKLRRCDPPSSAEPGVRRWPSFVSDAKGIEET